MADRLRIVTRPDRGRRRTLTILDLADPVVALIVPTRGTWKITPGGKAAQTVSSPRRYGGDTEVGDKIGNATIARTFGVRGASADAALLNVERIIQATRNAFATYLEWRPDGASRSVFFDVRGAATYDTRYEWVQFAGARLMEVDLSFTVGPLAIGDACDFTEDWSGAAPLDDYTERYRVPPATTTDVVTATGLQAAGNLAFRHFTFTGRGHLGRDMSATASFIVPNALNGFVAGVRVCENAATSGVQCVAEDDGATSRIRIYTIVNDVVVQGPLSVNLTRLVAGQRIWIRGRNEGYSCVAEFFTSPPGPASTPVASIGLTLTTVAEKALADQAGRAGVRWTPIDANSRVVSFELRPWTFTKRTLPESVPLRDVPGTGPPLFDAQVTHVGGAAVPVFALLGYDRRPAAHNWVWNGNAEAGVAGWQTGALAGGLSTGATITTTTLPAPGAKFGNAAFNIATTAVGANQGASFRMYRRVVKGRTYTVDVWLRSSSSGGGVEAFAIAGGADVSASAAGNLTLGWVRYVVSFVATNDREYVDLVIRNTGAAAAMAWQVDGVEFYEGTAAPTATQHAEGAGGYPPFGVLKAEASDLSAASGFALTADAGYLGGFGMKVTTAGGATATLVHYIDPALLAAEEFGRCEVDVEIWAVVELSSTLAAPRIVQSAAPAGGGASRPNEWGAGGRPLVLPSSGTRKRPIRVGVIRLPVDDPQRWKLTTSISYGVGSTGVLGVDYLVAVPARRRASSASGKANDAAYPKFLNTLVEATKTILATLAGRLALEPAAEGRDLGLGGAPLELPPPPNVGDTIADAELVAKLASLVPDDPTSDATAEQLSHSATVHAAITPTYYLTRPA